jgi:hypothetical protein
LRRIASRHRIVQVDDVERVGRLGAELQFESLGEIEVAENAEVNVLLSLTLSGQVARA